MDHRAQMVLVLYKRLIIFPPTYLMVRCDQIGKPIGCGRNIGWLVRRRAAVEGQSSKHTAHRLEKRAPGPTV